MIAVADVSVDERLYRDLADELIRFATGLVGPHDADDVMASAFARATSHRSWPTVANRRAYLYRAVHNEARSHIRSVLRRGRRESAWHTPTSTSLVATDADVVAAVARLSVRQRAVIVLTYWSDLDPVAVAELLGISEGSVRRHLARARAHLKEILR